MRKDLALERLRKWFGHDPTKWRSSSRAIESELESPGNEDFLILGERALKGGNHIGTPPREEERNTMPVGSSRGWIEEPSRAFVFTRANGGGRRAGNYQVGPKKTKK